MEKSETGIPAVVYSYAGNLHQMKTSWHTEGTTWMRVMDLHDQSLVTYEVPQPMNVHTIGWMTHVNIVSPLPKKGQESVEVVSLRKLPRFHKQLYTVVTGARCCG